MKLAGCVCSKNCSFGRATAGRSAVSVSSKMMKPADAARYSHDARLISFFVRWPASLPAGSMSSRLNDKFVHAAAPSRSERAEGQCRSPHALEEIVISLIKRLLIVADKTATVS